jgi:hypothetical protein
MTYHSKRFEKETVKAHNIFFASHPDYNGKKVSHYFYCIHSQEDDVNNNLFRDIAGLIITTKKPEGYYSRIKINGKEAFVCADREIRFISSVDNVQLKRIEPTKKEKKELLKIHQKYYKEKTRQLKKELKP